MTTTTEINDQFITEIGRRYNVTKISVCMVLRESISTRFQENCDYLTSNGCDVDVLRSALNEIVGKEVQDFRANDIHNMFSTLMGNNQGSIPITLTEQMQDIYTSKETYPSKKLYFEDFLDEVISKLKPTSKAVVLLTKTGFTQNSSPSSDPLRKYKHVKEHCVDLNVKAASRRIDPLIGRVDEVQRMLEILSHYKKKNPLLVGEPGVGKTHIAEGLASKIEAGDVPDHLKGARVFSVSIGDLLAGAKFRGEFEEKVKNILEDLKKIKESEGIYPVLFIDEIHQAIGAGAGASKEGVDMANMLKPALANGDLSCIGATTQQEFDERIRAEKALMRRFQVVKVEEPSKEETLRILELGIKPVLQDFHGVTYAPEVLKRIVDLSDQYITQEFFPDKAISIADSIGAKLNANREILETGRRDTTVDDVEQVISTITGTPVEAFKQKREEAEYEDLSESIKQVIFGQDEAIETIVEQVEYASAGFRDEGQPLGAFLLVGPTGTGKTELAKQIANKTSANFFQLNMSEYTEEHSVAKLFGSPPGYVGTESGGVLTNEIMNRPHTVLLLDEIEKAHGKVYDALLGIIDGAKMKDGKGVEVDFSNVLVLMTSNAGATVAANTKATIGLGQSDKVEETKVMAQADVIKATFKPEFRNKITGIVTFNSLSKEHMIRIVDKFINVTSKKLLVKGIVLNVDQEAKELIAERGYDPAMGARPIKREVDMSITKRLVKPMLQSKVASGDEVNVTVKDGEIIISFDKIEKEVEVKQ